MDAITAIADRHGLAVVEDACQAHGAEFRGRRVGSFGHGAFSLYGTKNMTTGEGGLITTDDDRLADWIRLYRNQGMRERYRHEILGYNFRLTDIAAAIGLCQLDKLERNTARRQAIARALRRGLRRPADPDAGHARPGGPTSSTSTRSTSATTATAIVADLAAAGVATGIYYPIPVHRQPYVLERGLHADLPVTDRAAGHTLSLPMYPGLTDDEQATVIAAVRDRRRTPRAAPARERRRRAMTGAWSPVGDRELRVGLIGLGSMGRNHLRVLSAICRASAWRRSPTRIRSPLGAASARHRRPGFAEPLAMLAEADLDAVVIAAPTTSHLPLALAAIERGIAVLVEKPLAATPAEADRIVAAASAPGAPPVQVGHIERFNPADPRARARCSRPAGCRRSSRSRAVAPGRSRRASATSG